MSVVLICNPRLPLVLFIAIGLHTKYCRNNDTESAGIFATRL